MFPSLDLLSSEVVRKFHILISSFTLFGKEV